MKKVINIEIGGRIYKMWIDETKEEVVREAEKIINEKMLEYSEGEVYRDKQDLLAMLSMQYVIKYLDKEKNEKKEKEKLEEKIKEIENILEESKKVL